MDTRYSLACQYLGSLQLTTGLTEADLSAPNLFAVCGATTGQTSSTYCPHKFTSGRFVDEAGNDLPKNPLRWPGGYAIETNLGPWRYSEDALREAVPDHRGCAPAHSREELIEILCDDHAEAGNCSIDYTVDLPIFDPAGPNAASIAALDRAQWKIFTGSQTGSYRTPAEGDLLAFWRFSDGSSVRLAWNPENLISGAHLLQSEPGKGIAILASDARTGLPFNIWDADARTGLHFMAISDALAYVALLPSGPADPIAAARDENGDEGDPRWELNSALSQSVHFTRIVIRR